MSRKILHALAFIAAIALAGEARADPLFESQDFLSVRLTGTLRTIARDRDSDPEYRPGSFSYTDSQGQVVDLEVKLRPRGNSRRKRDTCTFPPLRLNFVKKQVKGTLFDGQDKLKLVTHCRTSARHAAYVYKEYLAYRMLTQVSDASFRVRGLEIEYIDTDRNGRSESHFGFFIEDKRRLARRLHLKAAEPERITPADLEAEHASLMELFQFMIGNTDFSFVAPAEDDYCCHNAVLLKNDEGQYLPVPYDFDMSGLVDPPYAVVAPQLRIDDVRDRAYRGFCHSNDARRRAMERLRAAQSSILNVVRTETPLDGRHRGKARDYLEAFFAILDDPKALERQVLDACRG